MDASSRSPVIDIAVNGGEWPAEDALRGIAERAVEAALGAIGWRAPPKGAALSILFTDDSAMRELNARWRGKDKPTNVLSFPQPPGPRAGGPLPLGDIVLAAETVAAEAARDGKRPADHLRHLVVHGCLHLLGHDHQDDAGAARMEEEESLILRTLGVADPHAEEAHPAPADRAPAELGP